MLLALLYACHGGKVELDSDTGTPISWETGLWTDSGDSAHTGHTGETGETGDTAVASWVLVQAAPDGMVAAPGATWPLRLSAQDSAGSWSDVDGAWASSDPAVISVDDADVATAVAVGTATLTGSWEGLSATLSAEVREDGTVVVSVVDQATGALVTGASLVVDDGDLYKDDDGDGTVSAPVTSAGPIAITVKARNYVPVTYWGTVSRSLTVPLRSAEAASSTATISGTVDLSEVPAGEFGQVVAGLAAGTVQGAPLLVDPDGLLAEDRTLDFYGVEASVPQNVYVGGVAETYATPVEAGSAGVWTLGGPLPIGDLTAGVSGTGDVLAILAANRDGLRWGWDAGGTLAAGDTLAVDLKPETTLDLLREVPVGALPLGFSGDEEVLVLVGQNMPDQGMVITGFGLGQDTVEVASADVALDGALSEQWVVVAQVDGLGSGGALVAAVADTDDSLPALPQVPSGDFDAASRAFSLSVDAGAAWVQVQITGGDGAVRDLYLAGGDSSGILPEAGIPFSYGSTTWKVLALHPATGTFEGYLLAGNLDADVVAQDAQVAGRASLRF